MPTLNIFSINHTKMIYVALLISFYLALQIHQQFHKPDCSDSDKTDNLHETWPPENALELFDPTTKMFNLQIRPKVVEDAESLSMGERRFNAIRSIYRGPPIHGSWLKQLVKMEQETHISREYPSYEVYPQIIDLREAVRAVREGKPVKQKPINDPPLHVLRYPAEVCHPQSVSQPLDLIVMIKSCAICSVNREKSRNSFMRQSLWSNFSIQFVFVTGLPAENHARTMNIDGYIYDTHMNGDAHQASTEVERLLSEFDTHRDMLIDDDYALVPAKVIQLIESIQPVSVRPHLNIGGEEVVIVQRPKTGSSIINSYWDIPEDDIPWNKYTGMSTGGAYMLGSELVVEAAIGGIFTRPIRMDDIYLGFVLAKLHRPMHALNGLYSSDGKHSAAIVPHAKAP